MTTNEGQSQRISPTEYQRLSNKNLSDKEKQFIISIYSYIIELNPKAELFRNYPNQYRLVIESKIKEISSQYKKFFSKNNSGYKTFYYFEFNDELLIVKLNFKELSFVCHGLQHIYQEHILQKTEETGYIENLKELAGF